MINTEVNDIMDFIRILRNYPEILDEIRNIILTEDLINLPKKFDEFVNKFDKFYNNEFKPLKSKVDNIEKDVNILKEDVRILKEEVKILKEDVNILKIDVKRLKIDVNSIKGDNFERLIREKAPSYLGWFIKRCKVISFEDLLELLEDSVDNGLINESEKNEVMRADFVVRGKLKEDNNKDIAVAVEVSMKIDNEDVERAYNRAKILSKALNLLSIPLCVGNSITKNAEKKANNLNVKILIVN